MVLSSGRSNRKCARIPDRIRALPHYDAALLLHPLTYYSNPSPPNPALQLTASRARSLLFEGDSMERAHGS